MLLAIYNTVEFYVIAVVVAAAVVALSARRDGGGAVRQLLLPTLLRYSGETRPAALELIALDDGNVLLRRHGLTGLGDRGAVSLAVEVKGFDVKIRERLVEGGGDPIDTAEVVLDFMGRERYFINYTAESVDGVAAFTFHNREGMHVIRQFNRS
ncbi:MAG: hypothetical protein K2K47_10740 [Duncaniella sp.]|nr:hypothetical protein [Duncaniella sp.]